MFNCYCRRLCKERPLSILDKEKLKKVRFIELFQNKYDSNFIYDLSKSQKNYRY